MHSPAHTFNDLAGMPWTLTALAMAGTQFALESIDASICVVAQHAAITVDETNTQNPFVLELDDNTSVAIDVPTMEALHEFLQGVAA